MNAALVSLHERRLAVARAAASGAISTLSETIEVIRKAELTADFAFTLPWLELARLVKAKACLGSIDYLALLTLRCEADAKQEECCASVKLQIAQEAATRKRLIGQLDNELWQAKAVAQQRLHIASQVLADKKHHALTVTAPSGTAAQKPPGCVAHMVGVFVAFATVAVLRSAFGFKEPDGETETTIWFIGVFVLGMSLPHLFEIFDTLRRAAKTENQARDVIATAQATYANETMEAEAKLKSTLDNLCVNLELAKQRLVIVQSAGLNLTELPSKHPRVSVSTPSQLPEAPPDSAVAFVVALSTAGPNPDAVINCMRELIPGLSLALAKAWAENTPIIVRQGLTRLEAEKFRIQLESVGAKVEIL